MLETFRENIEIRKRNHKWRKRNRHNNIYVKSVFPIENVKCGRNSYGSLNIMWLTGEDVRIEIGNYVSIGPEVKFLVGGNHDYRRISTWPFQSLVYNQTNKKKRGIRDDSLDIIIEDDVWIGYDAMIFSGVKIGRGSVISARAIVTKDVPSYSIYIGNRVIKKRFSEEIIEKLKNIDFSEIYHIETDEYEKYCQYQINENNIDEIITAFIKASGYPRNNGLNH